MKIAVYVCHCGGNISEVVDVDLAIPGCPVSKAEVERVVVNLVTRAISGPLDIRCDHSDLYFALNTGWIILMARDPQAVYDMNLAAIRVGEHADVRLPVMVVYDGFFTSHQKRRVQTIDDKPALKAFLGEAKAPYTALDPRHPVTFGPYMNDPDLINNKKQHSMAMEAARKVIPEVFAELEQLTGRSYAVADRYRMDDAEAAVVLLNSAAETAKAVADQMREEGKPEQMIEKIVEGKVGKFYSEVVLLDIDLGAGSSGFEVLEQLQRLDDPPRVLGRLGIALHRAHDALDRADNQASGCQKQQDSRENRDRPPL